MNTVIAFVFHDKSYQQYIQCVCKYQNFMYTNDTTIMCFFLRFVQMFTTFNESTHVFELNLIHFVPLEKKLKGKRNAHIQIICRLVTLALFD